jgi:Transglutaminase-like superfamily
MPNEPKPVVTTASKIAIAARSVWLFAVIRARLRRGDLPLVVRDLTAVDHPREVRARPVRLGRIVARTLAIGPWRARCLHTSLVLYRLLREQGERPELVIGLKEDPREKDAHAWVELGGRDVGPPPGRGRHRELARYAS